MLSFIAMRSSAPFFLFIAAALTLCATASAGASGSFDRSCWAAVPLDLDVSEDALVDGPATINVFRVEVPSPGVLLPEIFGLSTSLVELVSEDCRPLRAQDVSYVQQFPGRSVVRVHRPGVYYLRVTAGDTVEAGPYRLRVGFSEPVPLVASGFAAKDVKEWEDDDEGLTGAPKPRALVVGGSAAKDVEEWEDDDEGLTGGTYLPCSGETSLAIDEPGVLALDSAADLTVFLEPLTVAARGRMVFGPSREILTRVEPGTYSLRWAVPDESDGFCGTSVSFYPICGLRSADDHGDDFACASEIVIGSETSGVVRATDADLFSFVLASRATVVVETSGEADTYLTLFDAGGRPLTADDDGGDGRGSRIEAELSPGRYFLSIEGVGDSEGAYMLTASKEPF